MANFTAAQLSSEAFSRCLSQAEIDLMKRINIDVTNNSSVLSAPSSLWATKALLITTAGNAVTIQGNTATNLLRENPRYVFHPTTASQEMTKKVRNGNRVQEDRIVFTLVELCPTLNPEVYDLQNADPETVEENDTDEILA